MSNSWRFIFLFLLLFFILHFIRDILQIAEIHTLLSDSFRSNHRWCRPFCDYVVFPPEIFGIIASFMVIKRNTIGLLGKLLLVSLLFWPIALLMQ